MKLNAKVAKILLSEELVRLENQIKNIEIEMNALPKGTISIKKIGGREYPYLQNRENGKVVGSAIKKNENLEELKQKLEKRKQLKDRIKYLQSEIEEIEEMLGKKKRSIKK